MAIGIAGTGVGTPGLKSLEISTEQKEGTGQPWGRRARWICEGTPVNCAETGPIVACGHLIGVIHARMTPPARHEVVIRTGRIPMGRFGMRLEGRIACTAGVYSQIVAQAAEVPLAGPETDILRRVRIAEVCLKSKHAAVSAAVAVGLMAIETADYVMHRRLVERWKHQPIIPVYCSGNRVRILPWCAHGVVGRVRGIKLVIYINCTIAACEWMQSRSTGDLGQRRHRAIAVVTAQTELILNIDHPCLEHWRAQVAGERLETRNGGAEIGIAQIDLAVGVVLAVDLSRRGTHFHMTDTAIASRHRAGLPDLDHMVRFGSKLAHHRAPAAARHLMTRKAISRSRIVHVEGG